MIFQQILIIVTLCIPLPSYQHFVWPLNMCVEADICNHTWIPECGKDINTGEMRLFIDECDVFEYNCDYEKRFEPVNYSACFVYQVGGCPTQAPCPSNPTCPNHRFHRAGDHYIYITQARRMLHASRGYPTLKVSLPHHMLHGKRRYTPIPKHRRKTAKKPQMVTKKMTQKKCSYSMTNDMKIPQTNKITKTKINKMTKPQTKSKQQTVILRKEIVIRNGNRWIKVIKGIPTKAMNTKSNKIKDDSDFLE
ncbi:unnamed protein product [Chilo suppressalis]|uniref:Kazal-like domain-containing protein n=1 Tax=Chilo suppressalis TaxID=168631 RepID=A0ABN8B272_CHISP|nr:unnamed protein product [Chilo suppressalis]